jgi:hypothetical protein
VVNKEGLYKVVADTDKEADVVEEEVEVEVEVAVAGVVEQLPLLEVELLIVE